MVCLVTIKDIQSELDEHEMEAWQKLIRVLTHEIMNSIAPISSLTSTANVLIKENLIDTFQEMEWAFVTNNLSSFCASVYRQLEIFTNHCLFEIKKCNDNIDFDGSVFLSIKDQFFIKDHTLYFGFEVGIGLFIILP